ncbi:hypothetical protein R3P38DRAFT_2771857 [Favolaschia claudopus]|uniref:Uncharacterized protein n=1 Tax=Favolaschia claudopus TaxID=2862362 RepID=A0AAW0CDC0_9AGAR
MHIRPLVKNCNEGLIIDDNQQNKEENLQTHIHHRPSKPSSHKGDRGGTGSTGGLNGESGRTAYGAFVCKDIDLDGDWLQDSISVINISTDADEQRCIYSFNRCLYDISSLYYQSGRFLNGDGGCPNRLALAGDGRASSSRSIVSSSTSSAAPTTTINTTTIVTMSSTMSLAPAVAWSTESQPNSSTQTKASPSPVQIPDATVSAAEQHLELSSGALAGIILGVLVPVLLLTGTILLLIRRRQHQKQQTASSPFSLDAHSATARTNHKRPREIEGEPRSRAFAERPTVDSPRRASRLFGVLSGRDAVAWSLGVGDTDAEAQLRVARAQVSFLLERVRAFETGARSERSMRGSPPGYV